MYGESVNSANLSRVVILFILSGLIVYQLWEHFETRSAFIVTGFFMISILLGELTRKFLRLFIKEKAPNPRIEIRDKPLSKEREEQRDVEALNYGIGWGLVICLWLCF